MTDKEWIYVIQIDSRRVIYRGSSEAMAAVALEPGTVFGKGETKYDAYMEADKRRTRASKVI